MYLTEYDKIVKDVACISYIDMPKFSEVTDAKDEAVEKTEEVEEDLESFNGTSEENDVESILNQIESVMEKAQTSKGTARFLDFKGASDIKDLAKLQDYNEDKKAETMDKAEDAKESTLEEVQETSAKDVVHKAYQELEHGDITYDEYVSILDSAKNTSDQLDEETVQENTDDAFIDYLKDHDMLEDYFAEHKTVKEQEKTKSLNLAKDEKDAAVKNMDEDGEEIVDEVLIGLKNEEITKEEYDDILSDTKALYGDGDQEKNISYAMQDFVGEGSIGDNLKDNIIVEYIQDGIKKQGGSLLERGKIVKAMSGELVENGLPNNLMKKGQKILKYGPFPIKAATAGFGMYDDVFNEGKTPGKATTHTASSLGASAIGSVAGGAAVVGGAFLLGATPAGWAVLGASLVGGAIGSSIFENKYEGDGKLKKGLDKMGSWIDNKNPL